MKIFLNGEWQLCKLMLDSVCVCVTLLKENYFSECGFWTSRQITQAQEGPPHILCGKPAHRNAHCSSGL